MRRLRTLVPALALAALAAGEPAAPAPVVLRAADGAELVKAWDASLYAKVWADPAAAPLRQAWTDAMQQAQAELGFDPIAALMQMRGFEARFLGMAGKDTPRVHIRLALGEFAAPVFALMKKAAASGEAKQVEGADEAWGDAEGSFARFKDVLVIAVQTPHKPAAPAGASPAAIALDLDAKALVEAVAPAVPEHEKAQFDQVIDGLKPLLGRWTYRGDIVPEGIRERLEGDVATPGTQAVDRSILARLPASTLMTAAYGFDGAAYWTATGQTLLTQLDAVMHPFQQTGADATAQEIEAALAMLGVQGGLKAVVEGLSGTSLIAISQGMPFPALTIALPRSASTDALLAFGLGQIGAQPPAEGQSTPIEIPGAQIPVAITLVRDAKHWVLTTDPMLAGSWPSGQPGGFADTAMAKTLYAQAPAGASLLGASDTPAVLRTAQGLLGLVLMGNEDLTPDQKQAINGAILRLSQIASTGYVWSATEGNRSSAEVRGLVGAAVVPIAVGATVAAVVARQQADMMAEFAQEGQAQPTTPEGKAIDTLQSALFPAQFQFQGGAYVDQDGDGIGEYATLAELTGAAALPSGKQAEPLAVIDAESGYRFAVWLPDGKGAALQSAAVARVANAGAAEQQERSFVIYAWPADGSASTRSFAIDQTGVVFEAPYTGKEPAWNELYSGQGWDGVPSWQPAQR
jgi:hypothetical protein